VYQISSLTKQFTAAAILRLVERGAIRLDDEIRKYVPEYSKERKPVTILQLLNHTSGGRWAVYEFRRDQPTVRSESAR
jgi:CubicO group peptidase (beta-lactamase class C family)